MRITLKMLIVAAAAVASGGAFAQTLGDRANRPAAQQPQSRQSQVITQPGARNPADAPYAKVRGGLSQGFAPIDTESLINRSGQR